MDVFTIILVTVLLMICAKFFVIFTKGRCTSKATLHGKTVLITGANSGIGQATAIDLARRGARIILACRTLKTAEETKAKIIQKTGNTNVVIYPVDFESLESVRQLSKTVHENEKRLDILINNAGAGGLGDRLSKDGLHIGMQVNHFAPFLLTNLLLDLLKKSAPSRIVNVASLAYLFSYLDPNNLNKDMCIFTIDRLNYCNSKLCNILMTNELAVKLKGTNVTANCVHPGSVSTNLFQHMRWWIYYPTILVGLWLFKNSEEGAQTTIHLAVCEKVEGVTGKYFADCKKSIRWRNAADQKLSEKVWNESTKIVQLQKSETHY